MDLENSKIKVAAITNDSLLSQAITEDFQNHESIQIIGVVKKLYSMLALLNEKEINILLIDILLNEKECFFLLERINSSQKTNKPACIVISSKNSFYIRSNIMALGVKSILHKPITTSDLEKAILEVVSFRYDYLDKNVLYEIERIEEYASLVLSSAGVKSNLKGFVYLKEAIILAIKDPEIMQSVTKVLYPFIAKLHKTTPQNVERAIRHALCVSLVKYDGNRTNLLNDLVNNNSKITNSQFIKFVSEQYNSF